MVSPQGLLRGLREPQRIRSAVTRKLLQYNRKFTYWHNGVDYFPYGIDIFEQDWDNLVLLDACRYDSYSAQDILQGDLRKVHSQGSMSSEFVRGNFRNQDLLDVVYVSANYWYELLLDDLDATIYKFVKVERDAYDDTTTRAESVTEAARTANERYPNKRLIVHYLQPHSPYFHETGEEWFRLPAVERPELLVREDQDREQIKRAYQENLRYVLREVDRLLPDLVGKTVISSDHGELLGEWLIPGVLRKYDHPEGYHVDELLEVPWDVHHTGERKTIEEATGCERDSGGGDDDSSATENLLELGYIVE